jgi:hypothetical protein
MPARHRTRRRRRKSRGGGTLRGVKCAPARGTNSYSCYSLADLRHFATELGIENTQNRNTNNKQYLWNAIDTELQSECNTEYCWANRLSHSKRLTTAAFRPAMPDSWKANRTQWLNSNDIRYVMSQYEDAISGFRFIGPVPVDFQTKVDGTECVSPDLCTINLQRWWKKGVRKLGIIFNLDSHDMSGSHWVAAYCDLTNAYVGYYDSFGTAPPIEISDLLHTISEQGESLFGMPFAVHLNHTRHQFRNTECGVYSMYFIITLATQEISFQKFIKEYGHSDDEINRFRTTFYHTFK